MKFFRKRWWGFYALTPFVALTIPVITIMSYINFTKGNHRGILVGLAATAICILGLMYLYAPYTFHFVSRFIGLMAFLGYFWYLFDCIIKDHWFSTGHSNEYALNAITGLIFFGIPGLLIFIFHKRPIHNPYRRDGSLRKPLLRHINELNDLLIDSNSG